MPTAKLERTIISITGEAPEDFLGGLITNSLKDNLSFAALLTPQGKIIADFFIHKTEQGLILETPVKFGKALMTRLKMYKLRAKIDLEDISEDAFIYAFWGGQGEAGVPDPRDARLGARLLTEDILPAEHTQNYYDAHRLSLGIPDSTWDFDTQEVFPADANMDSLCGVDYKKGCFIGQEVVSRMHRKTTVRKRMRGLSLSGEAKAGDAIVAGSLKIGTILHARGSNAMALIRLDRAAKAQEQNTVNEAPVTIMEPQDGLV